MRIYCHNSRNKGDSDCNTDTGRRRLCAETYVIERIDIPMRTELDRKYSKTLPNNTNLLQRFKGKLTDQAFRDEIGNVLVLKEAKV